MLAGCGVPMKIVVIHPFRSIKSMSMGVRITVSARGKPYDNARGKQGCQRAQKQCAQDFFRFVHKSSYRTCVLFEIQKTVTRRSHRCRILYNKCASPDSPQIQNALLTQIHLVREKTHLLSSFNKTYVFLFRILWCNYFITKLILCQCYLCRTDCV